MQRNARSLSFAQTLALVFKLAVTRQKPATPFARRNKNLLLKLSVTTQKKGSDSGGSIRNPAHNCGIVALKTTIGRLPLRGQALDGCFPGIPGGAIGSTGFMVRSVEDLETIHQLVLESNHLKLVQSDARFVPVPWQQEEVKPAKSLVFGWYDYDGLFEATPGCRRAVQVAIRALERDGFKVVPFRPRHVAEAWRLNSLYRQGDSGLTKREEHSFGPSCQISLGLRLLQWYPWLLRYILGLGKKHALYWSKRCEAEGREELRNLLF